MALGEIEEELAEVVNGVDSNLQQGIKDSGTWTQVVMLLGPSLRREMVTSNPNSMKEKKMKTPCQGSKLMVLKRVKRCWPHGTLLNIQAVIDETCTLDTPIHMPKD